MSKRSLSIMIRSAAASTALFAMLLSSLSVQAQSPAGDLAVGAQLGEPSGITAKIYQRSDFAYELLAAWDLDDFFFLNGHALFEQPIPESPLHYYIGPGAVVGVRDEGGGGNEFVLGVSGQLGVNFFVERYEVFLHITPRLGVIPDTNGDVGGGIGLRYYF